MTEYRLSHFELMELMDRTAEATAKHVLREAGLIKKVYTRAEVVRLYGVAEYEKSKQYVRWQKKGEGKTSPVICQCREFEQYIRKFNVELKTIK